MKKLYFLFVFCLAVLSVSAQDIIVTKQSERIDCKVTEITETLVKYKQKSNPNGPLFTLSASKVASIIFENGEVFTFKDAPVEVEQQEVQENTPESVAVWQDEPEVEIPIALQSGKQVMFRSGVQIEVVNGKTYYGGEEIKYSDYQDFLKQTCTAAFQEEMDAKRLAKISGVFGWPAVFFMGVALFKEIKPMINGSMYEADFDMWNGWGKPVLTWVGVSCGFLAIALPISNNSIKHAENARVIFNRDCAQTPQKQTTASLSFNVSPLGAGISLTF